MPDVQPPPADSLDPIRRTTAEMIAAVLDESTVDNMQDAA